ncbi:MAG: hypothetical protein IJH34_12635 [Romboutsia sp.]|nr:hypothetical protein [Romboutsia sp.]
MGNVVLNNNLRDRISKIIKSEYLEEKVKCEVIYITKTSPMKILFTLNPKSFATKDLISIGVSESMWGESEYDIYVQVMHLGIHEASHHRYSNFFQYSRCIKLLTQRGLAKYPELADKKKVFEYIAATIQNCIEDGRIERISCANSIRNEYFIVKSNNKIWEKRDILKENKSEFDDFFHSLINLCVLDSLPLNYDKKYKDDSNLTKKLKEIYPLVKKGIKAKTCSEGLRISQEIFDSVIDYLMSIHEDAESFEYEIEFTTNPTQDNSESMNTMDYDGESDEPIEKLPTKPKNYNKNDKKLSNIDDIVKNEVEEKCASDKRKESEENERNSRRPINVRDMEDILKDYRANIEFHNVFDLNYSMSDDYILEGKKLRKVFEEHIQKKNRVQTKRFKAGKLNTSDVYRTYMGKEDIFKKNRPHSESIAFELILDMSGSMCGMNYEQATKALSIIEYALAGLYPTKIIGFNTSDPITHYYLIRDFKDSYRKINYSSCFASQVGCNNCNRDAVIVSVAAKELSKRPEQQKVLIVLSDGSPNSSYSSGKSAIEELRESVKKTYKSSIDAVIPIYFGNLDEQSQEDFRYMYLNKNIIFCEPDEITLRLKRIIQTFVLK